ncbi:hypothetical protein RF11_10984 [Thelohanellus kitauei]|uniref:Uncharacterized protein n=1 Tax=Thelohanellus kitauei TaxID=669202 RepID=A0A0C2MHB5_THEKT|nr:hypothetical protein RF11_10984 [Thelohanellus kitauei]
MEKGKYEREVSNTLNIKIPNVYRIVNVREKETAAAGKRGRHKPSSLIEETKRRLDETINDCCMWNSLVVVIKLDRLHGKVSAIHQDQQDRGSRPGGVASGCYRRQNLKHLKVNGEQGDCI